jgi:hypothetical protein
LHVSASFQVPPHSLNKGRKKSGKIADRGKGEGRGRRGEGLGEKRGSCQ